jgi:cytochrome P450
MAAVKEEAQANRNEIAKLVANFFAADPTSLSDPYPMWETLRSDFPVLSVGGSVVLSRHADVKELLGDNNVLYSRAQNRYSPRYQRAYESFNEEERGAFDNILDNEYKQVVRLDPPEHPRVRKTVQPAFGRKRLIERMTSVVQERVDANLDLIADEGDISDFHGFAQRVPIEVLGIILGIPIEEVMVVSHWADTIGAQKLNVASGEVVLAAASAYQKMRAYIDSLVVREIDSPSEDGLVRELIEAEANNQINHDDLIGLLTQLFLAGFETTANLLTIGLFELLKNEDQWALLCADETLAPQAVEELLRYTSPVHLLQYVSVQAREMHGVEVAAGDTVIGILAAANRDPDVFEDPDRLDLTRHDSRNHVALGYGPHFCLGSHLARIEGDLSFRTLARRFPGVRLVGETLEWGGSAALRTPTSLPIRLSS